MRFALLVLPLLLSCAGVRAPEPDRRSVPLPFVTGSDSRYPPQRYLVGVGEGRTLEAARRQAVVAIAGQLQATIRSADTLQAVSWRQDEAGSETESLAQEVRVETRFDRLEWIRVADSFSSGGSWVHVLCVLDRSHAAAILEAELEVQLAALRPRLERLEAETDPRRVGLELPRLQRLADELLPSLALLGAVRGMPPQTPPELARLAAQEARLSELRRSVALRVCVEPGSRKPGVAELAAQFGPYLAGRELTVVPCTDPPVVGGWRLTGQVDAETLAERNHPGSYRYFCSTRLDYQVVDEGTGALRLGGSTGGARLQAGGQSLRDACHASLQRLTDALGRALGIRDETATR